MTTASTITMFKVDSALCIGCGACVEACPMHILEVRDGLSCMTKSRLCLECGSCVRACARHAIAVTQGEALDSAPAVAEAGGSQACS